MNWLFAVAGCVALIILVSGLVNWGNMLVGARRDQMKGHAGNGPDDELGARLDELEARMRDVLDVMIALSEKMDRWERDGVPVPRQMVSGAPATRA